ncbi:mcl1 [Pungitius sinensis]
MSQSPRGTNDVADEGSEPSSVPGRRAGDDVLNGETRQLIAGCLAEYTTAVVRVPRSESKALSTMKRVVGDLLTKHTFAFNGMVSKASSIDQGKDTKCIGAVADYLFADGVTNWSRVAALVAFGSTLCQQAADGDRGDRVKLVGDEISTYLLTNQKTWLEDNDSWNGFVEFFRTMEPEYTSSSAVVTFAKYLVVGVTLTLLIRLLTETTVFKGA